MVHVAKWELKERKDIATLENDTRATVVEAVGGLLLLGGLFFAWRNLRALQEQIEVTQTTHAVERFVRLREHAISREHADLERRVAALLRHLDGLALTPKDLDYAPDINLYLNDYLWIGRFVRLRLYNVPRKLDR